MLSSVCASRGIVLVQPFEHILNSPELFLQVSMDQLTLEKPRGLFRKWKLHRFFSHFFITVMRQVIFEHILFVSWKLVFAHELIMCLSCP